MYCTFLPLTVPQAKWSTEGTQSHKQSLKWAGLFIYLLSIAGEESSFTFKSNSNLCSCPSLAHLILSKTSGYVDLIWIPWLWGYLDCFYPRNKLFKWQLVWMHKYLEGCQCLNIRIHSDRAHFLNLQKKSTNCCKLSTPRFFYTCLKMQVKTNPSVDTTHLIFVTRMRPAFYRCISTTLCPP